MAKNLDELVGRCCVGSADRLCVGIPLQVRVPDGGRATAIAQEGVIDYVWI